MFTVSPDISHEAAKDFYTVFTFGELDPAVGEKSKSIFSKKILTKTLLKQTDTYYKIVTDRGSKSNINNIIIKNNRSNNDILATKSKKAINDLITKHIKDGSIQLDDFRLTRINSYFKVFLITCIRFNTNFKRDRTPPQFEFSNQYNVTFILNTLRMKYPI